MRGVGYKGPSKARLMQEAEKGLPETFSASAIERAEARFRVAAEDLLENVLRRRRWTVEDRDKVAEFLLRLADRERRAAAKRAGGSDA